MSSSLWTRWTTWLSASRKHFVHEEGRTANACVLECYKTLKDMTTVADIEKTVKLATSQAHMVGLPEHRQEDAVEEVMISRREGGIYVAREINEDGASKSSKLTLYRDWLEFLNFKTFNRTPVKKSFYATVHTVHVLNYSCIFGLTGSWWSR